MSLEAKAKSRASHLGKILGPRSLEVRLKISRAHIGMPSPHKGIPHTAETRLRMSQGAMGKKCPWVIKNHPHYKGKDHWNWKGGITSINRSLRNSLDYEEWRKKVFERDSYTCQICNKVGDILHANHIKKFSDYPDLRFEVSNGITLCKHCHLSIVTGKEPKWEQYFYQNLQQRGLFDD